MKRTVQVSAIENVSNNLRIDFSEKLRKGKKVTSFLFWNFHENGDRLARAMSEFIDFGVIPNDVKGLQPI